MIVIIKNHKHACITRVINESELENLINTQVTKLTNKETIVIVTVLPKNVYDLVPVHFTVYQNSDIDIREF